MEVNQLASLGLSESQIKRILERLPKESVHLFIKKWIAEKGVSYQQTQQQSDIRRTGEYSARRKNHSVEPRYSRDMEYRL